MVEEVGRTTKETRRKRREGTHAVKGY